VYDKGSIFARIVLCFHKNLDAPRTLFSSDLSFRPITTRTLWSILEGLLQEHFSVPCNTFPGKLSDALRKWTASRRSLSCLPWRTCSIGYRCKYVQMARDHQRHVVSEPVFCPTLTKQSPHGVYETAESAFSFSLVFDHPSGSMLSPV
jgi:hypothetical protein